MAKLPKVPSHFFSAHGPLPIVIMSAKKSAKKGVVGLFDWCARTILLRPDMKPEADWITLWHEATHAALFDSGAHQALTKKQEEAVCDSIGHYLTAAMQAGWLKVTVPQAVRKS